METGSTLVSRSQHRFPHGERFSFTIKSQFGPVLMVPAEGLHVSQSSVFQGRTQVPANERRLLVRLRQHAWLILRRDCMNANPVFTHRLNTFHEIIGIARIIRRLQLTTDETMIHFHLVHLGRRGRWRGEDPERRVMGDASASGQRVEDWNPGCSVASEGEKPAIWRGNQFSWREERNRE